ncbi:MAG: hypothetical protein UZ21_OP11001000835 [Microgenomates bacterium OLB22]|nr:MAG: hypothetical protein UZ21_OP11001000835 [Microgenomates bacterium OLB22]
MKRHFRKTKNRSIRPPQETPPSHDPTTSISLSVKKDLIRTIVFVSLILVLEFLVFFANVNTMIVRMFHN